jgi:3-(3-hydroxy-phenyl)propionate hydroxylase
MMEQKHVGIVGAGPVGLTAALGLAQQGVRVSVYEAEAALTHDLRAGSFHPPTLDMLGPLGVTARMLDRGIKVRRWQIRDRNEGVVAEFDLGMIADATDHPYRLHLEQHRLTPILKEMLEACPGASIAFGHRFVAGRQDGDRVVATFATKGGPVERDFAYLIGADGGRSAVRKALGVEFEGFTWPERFLVISTTYDLEQDGFAYNAYISDPEEWVAIFKMPHDGPPGLWRLAFPTDTAIPEEEILSDAFVLARLHSFLPHQAAFDIPYRSAYRVHQRVAKQFRIGRVLLAGDAAHVNNPLGALGLNGGIHDAINLAEKLGRILRGEADAALLDLYERQRRLTNIEYVQAMSIRNKRTLEERDPLVRRQRLDELRATAADPQRAREHLLNTSMIASVRRAAAIA